MFLELPGLDRWSACVLGVEDVEILNLLISSTQPQEPATNNDLKLFFSGFLHVSFHL